MIGWRNDYLFPTLGESMGGVREISDLNARAQNHMKEGPDHKELEYLGNIKLRELKLVKRI